MIIKENDKTERPEKDLVSVAGGIPAGNRFCSVRIDDDLRD